MPKYLIEREIPGAGNLSQPELQGISQTSCGVLQKMGPQIQWVRKLRDRRQGLLRLHRAERRDDSRARQPGRLSR